MKTTFFLFVLAISLGAARAQDADYSDNSDYSIEPATEYQAPAVVYNAPVTYAAPVVYNMPVVYNGPVYYGLPMMAMGYALNACSSACNDYNYRSRSTVVYIGGSQVRFQVSPPCNTGSLLVIIGR